jgi:outer membrane protein assembly factor BamB
MKRAWKYLTLLAVVAVVLQSAAHSVAHGGDPVGARGHGLVDPQAVIDYCAGEDWPGWRGPRGDGTSLETGVPTKWSGSENVTWKTPIPGKGHSSPVIWGERIFLTTAIAESKDRLLLSLDRKTGKILWSETVVTAPLEAKQPENSYASSTPVTDGEKVYVAFLDGKDVVVAAYDFSGKRQWIVRPGRFDSGWGFCHSPVLFDGKVLIACCGQKTGFIAALSPSDGRAAWRIEPTRLAQAFSSPLVREMAGRAQMIVPTNSLITSYDPKDGAALWTVSGPSKEYVATPVFHEKTGLLLCASSWPVKVLVAINPDGQGDVTKRKVVWQTKDGAPYVPSPIAVGDYYLTSSSKQELYCYDAASGNVLWKKEGVGQHHASPVAVDGMVYFLNDEGVMHVVKAGPKFELVAKNELGEETYASPAISRGQIFLRGFHNLYCIGLAR